MNKVLTFAGSQPVYLGDVDFIQAASAQIATLLARALMGNGSDTLNGIIQGVEISYGSGVITWTAGVVIISGEILPVEAGEISGSSSDALYFHVNSVLSGDRTFKNGETHQCWDTRTATISTTSADGVLVSSVPRYTRDDSAQWNGDITSSYITKALLFRKNGFYSLDIELTLPDDLVASSLGTVDFSGLSAGDVSAIVSVPFYAEMFIEVTATGNVQAVPVVLEFLSTGDGSVQLTTALGQDLPSSAGNAFIRVQYPLT